MTGSHTADELEAMAAVLEASGQYRVLRSGPGSWSSTTCLTAAYWR